MPDHDHTIDPFDDFAWRFKQTQKLARRLGPISEDTRDQDGAASLDRMQAVERIAFAARKLTQSDKASAFDYLIGRFPTSAAWVLAELHPVPVAETVLTWHSLDKPCPSPETCPFCFEPEDDALAEAVGLSLQEHDPVEDPDPALVVEVERPGRFEDCTGCPMCARSEDEYLARAIEAGLVIDDRTED